MNSVSELFSMKGKVVLVTGGAKGIGRAISDTMADAGASLAVIYHKSVKQAADLSSGLNVSGVPNLMVGADLQNENEVKDAVAAIAKYFGHIDVVVNNAGIFSLRRQNKLEKKEWEKVFAVNTTGLFLVVRECLKHMVNPGCSIVNISSMNAMHPGFGQTAHYDASKGAVDAYTRSLAAELAPQRIRVNAVAPGLVDSPALRKNAPDLADQVKKRTPLGRLTVAEDVANSVLFLASDAASHITGTCLLVDGGYLLT